MTSFSVIFLFNNTAIMAGTKVSDRTKAEASASMTVIAMGEKVLPSTPENVIEYVLDELDLVLLMTVNPGFGGQAFIPSVVEKVRRIKAMIGDRPIDIEIDGGVSPANAGELTAAGANVLVAGSAVFKGEGEEAYAKNIAAIRNSANG